MPKRRQSLDTKITTLARTVEKGFAAIAHDIAQRPTNGEVRAIVVEAMPGIVALELKPVRQQLKHIEDRLTAVDEHYANLKGVTKEIDDLRGEVGAIKRHLGLTPKIAG